MPVQLSRFVRTLRRLRRDSAGVSSLELGIVMSLMALAALQSLTALGGEVETDVNTASAAVAEKRPERADPFAKAAKNDLTNGQSAVENGTLEPVEPAPAASQVYTTNPTQPPPVMMSPPVPY